MCVCVRAIALKHPGTEGMIPQEEWIVGQHFGSFILPYCLLSCADLCFLFLHIHDIRSLKIMTLAKYDHRYDIISATGKQSSKS